MADIPMPGRTTGDIDLFDDARDDEKRLNISFVDASDFIVDIREYDVPYHVRVMIDMGESSRSSAIWQRLSPGRSNLGV